MAAHSKLDDLIHLAREPSSERRRELLREVTDLFFSASGPHGPAEMALFDGVLSKLAQDMEEEVRSELAERFSTAPAGPANLMSRLATDESIAVAAPVLTRSNALTEADLLKVARTRGQEHLRALSQRADLSETVSDTVVARGDDTTLGVLLRNPEAPLSRRFFFGWRAGARGPRHSCAPFLHRPPKRPSLRNPREGPQVRHSRAGGNPGLPPRSRAEAHALGPRLRGDDGSTPRTDPRPGSPPPRG